MTETVGEQLTQHIEAIERLLEEKKGIADDVKDRYSLAKGEGYDVKILRQVIKRRALEREEREQMDELVATYEAAIAS